jgi:hypothetical protein
VVTPSRAWSCASEPHLDAQLRVEVRERLVYQERLRLAHDRAPHGDALALPARGCAGTLEQLFEPEQLRHVDAASRFVPAAPHLQARRCSCGRSCAGERVALKTMAMSRRRGASR